MRYINLRVRTCKRCGCDFEFIGSRPPNECFECADIPPTDPKVLRTVEQNVALQCAVRHALGALRMGKRAEAYAVLAAVEDRRAA